MADINQMKAAAAAQGASPPPDYPGGPEQWVQDWYQNAVNAGSIQGTHTQGNLAEGGQGYANTGTSSFADMIRQKSKAEGWSEDFARFSDAQIEAWKPSYDANSGRFRSEGGGGALVEKPTDCPEGTTLHGSKCIGYDQANELFGGGYGGVPQVKPGAAAGAGAGAGGAVSFGQDDPLQRHLTNLMAGGGGTFGGTTSGGQFAGGGVFSQGSGQGGSAMVNSPAAHPATAALNAFGAGAPAPVVQAPAPVVQAPAPAAVVAPPAAPPILGAGPLQSVAAAAPHPAPTGGAFGAARPKAPDAFGIGQGNGSFEDLIDSRRMRKDARLGGSWF